MYEAINAAVTFPCFVVFNSSAFFIAIHFGLDRVVIIGSHHDAWVMGAVDPCSAAATLMETVRAVGVAVRKG